jgi:5-methylcytosine-specific restriction protein A
MRSVPIWRGKTDDTPIPARVKDRILRRNDDCCANCKRAFMGKLRPEFDHIVALAIGGANAELNIEPLCENCHAIKSKSDVRLKAKVARIRVKRLGLRAPRRKIQSPGFPRSEPQRTASRPIEKRT